MRYHAMIGCFLRGLGGCFGRWASERSSLVTLVKQGFIGFGGFCRYDPCQRWNYLSSTPRSTFGPFLQTMFSFFHPLVAINLSLSHSVPQSLTHLLCNVTSVRRSLCISQGEREREAWQGGLALGELSVVQGSCFSCKLFCVFPD